MCYPRLLQLLQHRADDRDQSLLFGHEDETKRSLGLNVQNLSTTRFSASLVIEQAMNGVDLEWAQDGDAGAR